MSPIRERIGISGVVQGVGFRPFVYRTARECGLAGFVRNDGAGVTVEIEGEESGIERFHKALVLDSPPLSRITEIRIEDLEISGETGFKIVLTDRDGTATTLISPDISVCDDCRGELFDPDDRRYRYPFINCTNCGPRYTIVSGIPYDRPNTSMAAFDMCPACSAEYHDPEDRRFHTQPNGCPDCGPSLTLVNSDGTGVDCEDPVAKAISLLQEGKILAVRGLGGFHLAVDARNNTAVRELRRRKGRAEKPFALMAKDVAAVERFCELNQVERNVLEQPTRPIVILNAKDRVDLAGSVAPGNRYLGFMLPYTPLHELLLAGSFSALVMTSGNLSEEPIAIGNDEAMKRLSPLADFLLLHDREILQRCDDSIVRVAEGKERMIRRARGYAPSPLFLETPTRKNILATGPELKNTIGFTRDDHVFLSQHIGNLDNPAALAFFEHTIGHLGAILQIEPELVAHDLHPEYLSTKWATEQELPRVGVQHHHAHLAAVMAENGRSGPTIGLILDGTGYGTDGTVWGGEILVGDFNRFDRCAWLEPVPMPGGTAAIREPWRMALAWLRAAFGDEALKLPLPVRDHFMDGAVLFQAMDRSINSPLTSSCGRLFDAVASILDIRHEVSFEAQAAIDLEMTAEGEEQPYRLPEPIGKTGGKTGTVPVSWLIRAVADDFLSGTDRSVIASRFHATLAAILSDTVLAAAEKTGIDTVGLSGGVFQNMRLFNLVLERLESAGMNVLTHSILPAGDGCIALGQAVVADVQWSLGKRN